MTWRGGAKGRLAARFAVTRIRVAAKPEACAGDGAVWGNNRRLPGNEAWLVGEWRTSGERKYHLSNLPRRTSQRALAAAIKARWVCEQAHQSSSRASWGWATSRAAPGQGCTGTR